MRLDQIISSAKKSPGGGWPDLSLMRQKFLFIFQSVLTIRQRHRILWLVVGEGSVNYLVCILLA